MLDEYYSAFTYRCVDEVPVFAVQLVPSAESEKVMPVPAVQVLLRNIFLFQTETKRTPPGLLRGGSAADNSFS